MTDDPERIAKKASGKTYRKINREIAFALQLEPKHTDFPSKDFELIAKRIAYQKKRLDMLDEQKIKEGKPVRHPRLDKTRNRATPEL